MVDPEDQDYILFGFHVDQICLGLPKNISFIIQGSNFPATVA